MGYVCLSIVAAGCGDGRGDRQPTGGVLTGLDSGADDGSADDGSDGGGFDSGSTSGPPGGDGGDCAGITQKAENRVQPVDILIAVDNSGSMDDEVRWVRDNLSGLGGVNPGFSRQIEDSGLDFRVVLISSYPGNGNGICVEPPLGGGGCPSGDNNEPRFFHINREVGSVDGLFAMQQMAGQWEGRFRDDAAKHFVMITDDNSAMPGNVFDAWVVAHGGTYEDYRFHGIYAFTDCSVAADEGWVYQQLVTMTGGVAGDLCLQSFQPVFNALATSVIENVGIACDWVIPPPPAGEVLDPDLVNVLFSPMPGTDEIIGRVPPGSDCGDVADGWYYDDPQNPTRVIACPQTCTRIQGFEQAEVTIQFGCEGVNAPVG